MQYRRSDRKGACVLASMAEDIAIVGSEQALDSNNELQHVIVDNVSVPIANIVRDLVVNVQKTIYLVGEGNFTFTLAIVALRGSWHGITTTCLGKNTLLENFLETKIISFEWCIKNAKMLIGSDKIDKVKVFDGLEAILKVPRPDKINVEENVDCTTCTLNDQNIVWFQSPWLLDLEKIGQLLRDFLQNMNGHQKCHDYVLIGIQNIKDSPYPGSAKTFETEKLLAHALTVGYKLIGLDTSFVREMLEYGYKHKCVDENLERHEFLFYSHVTLVFEKQ